MCQHTDTVGPLTPGVDGGCRFCPPADTAAPWWATADGLRPAGAPVLGWDGTPDPVGDGIAVALHLPNPAHGRPLRTVGDYLDDVERERYV